MKRSYSGYLYIVLCAVIFSTMEVMLKTVHGVFAPMQITCLRFLIGGLLLVPFALRSMKKKGAAFTRADAGFFALTGFLCVAFSMVLYQMAVTYTKASVVALSFSVELRAVLLLGRTAAVGGLFASLGLDIFVNVPLFSGIPLSALPALAYICAVNSAAGYVCHMMALEKTSAQEASLIFFLKPMIAPLFAFLFLREEITANMLLGIVCFLVGSGIAILPGLIAQKKQRA